MSTYNTSEVSGQQGRPFLPKGVRTCRIIGAEKKTSSNKNDMLSLQFEIVAPESETVGGVAQKIAGITFRDQITFHGKNNIPVEQLAALTKVCKGNPQVDLDNPALLKSNYVGKAVRMEVRTEAKPLTQVGEDGNLTPVLDNDGQPIIDNNYRMGRFIGTDDRYTIPADAVV